MALKTILVIDDEHDIVELIAHHFRLKGYNVLKAYDGIEGLSIAETSYPDVILSDINMPNKNGIVMCRELKQQGKIKSTPIIFLSAINDDEIIMEALKAGGDDFISKPIQIPLLIKNVEALLDRNARWNPEVSL